MIKKISILLLLAMVSCNKALLDDAVYTLEGNSSTKYVECTYSTIPIPCGEDIVTIEPVTEETNNPSKYAFVKISPDGKKITKEFELNWTLHIKNDEEKLSDPNYKNDYNTNINLINDQYNNYHINSSVYNHTKFVKNSNGDFVIIIIDSDTDPYYNISRFGIIKFDSNGNVIYQRTDYYVDFTLKDPIVQTAFALNNGGYAIIYEYPKSEEDNYYIYDPNEYDNNNDNEYSDNEYSDNEYSDNEDSDNEDSDNEHSDSEDSDSEDSDSEYSESDNSDESSNEENEYGNIFMEIYDGQNNKVSQKTLEIGNDILINNGVNVGNTILLTSSDNTFMIDMEGKLLKESLLGYSNISNTFTVDDKYYISWSNNMYEGYAFSALDNNGNEISQQIYSNKNITVVILNTTKLNGENYFSGFIINNSRWAADCFSYTINNDIDGIVLSENGNSFNSNVINNVDDIVIFGITQNANGSYTIYYDINTLTDKWNQKIYIYTTNDINRLFAADNSFLYEGATEENSNNNNTDSYEY